MNNLINWNELIYISIFPIKQILELIKLEPLNNQRITLYYIDKIIYLVCDKNNFNNFNHLQIKFISEKLLNSYIITENILVNTRIKRHLISFYQSDQSIREFIHENISLEIKQLIFKEKTCIFLGGEMYIYGKIFDHLFNQKIYITDIKSIYLDSINNDPNPHKSSYYLVNYNTKFLIDINSNIDILISNISKAGLKKEICEQIQILNIRYLILISCKEKVIDRDIKLLTKYLCYKKIKISTNYDVFIGYLKLKIEK